MNIKCKVCGGDIQFSPGDTFGQCDHCGCTVTIPRTDDEQRLNRHDRADHFRRHCEFDKAIAAYERILEEDKTDAEAHWGIALSRYGIEYVEDPNTKKRVPTCHRVQVESILADVDYLDALKYAPDAESKKIYEAQAKEIAEIQKGILAISANEEPYDVFICYKETDDKGKRTKDSALAQEVYYGLVGQGYKAFFSRITLEDKLGQHYEPYIFAALNSAKVMVVIGTKAEHFNSVWVKNEWSRYLQLMKNDRSRLMIPCYRDMDPYDLPEELGNLQSQDMSKIGFLQDLLRGIRKVLDENQDKVLSGQQQGHMDPQQVNALLDRAFVNIEDGQFARADGFLEQVLNQEPRNSRAYLGKLLVERKAKNTKELAKGTIPLDDSVAYQRALRFADDKQRQQLESYNSSIINRSKTDQYAQIRDKALTDLKQALTVDQCKAIKKDLEAIAGFEGVYEALAACDEKIDQIYNAHYENAMKLFNDKEYVKARDAFEYIGDYKDSWKMAMECMYKYAYDAMNQGDYATAGPLFSKLGDYKASIRYEEICRTKAKLKGKKGFENVQSGYQTSGPAANPAQDELQKVKEDKIRLKKSRLKKLALALVCLAAVSGLVFFSVRFIIPTVKYNTALDNLQKGNYKDAQRAFKELGNFMDAEEKIQECITGANTEKYNTALDNMRKGNYKDALRAFEELGDFKDAEKKIQECVIGAHKDYISSLTTVGNQINFGSYEQNNVVDAKVEKIAWYVLDVHDDKCLLLSRDGLDAQQYNKEDKDITWANSSIRKWLNETFYNAAFDEAEQAVILTTTVDNSKSQGYESWNSKGGINTEDKVFLLSYKEANHYLGLTTDSTENQMTRVFATDFALGQGAQKSTLPLLTFGGSGTSWWWLRSPGTNQRRAAYVKDNGALGDSHLTDKGCVVRPAIWLDLEADAFYPIPKNYGK